MPGKPSALWLDPQHVAQLRAFALPYQRRGKTVPWDDWPHAWCTKHGARNKWQELVRSGLAEAPEHVAPAITSPAPQKTDPAELWRRAEDVTDGDVARTAGERFVDVTIEDDRPIGLSLVSDQHIATRGPVQMRRMREDAEFIVATPGLYALLGGDGADNHIKHRAAILAAGSKVSEQWALYDHYLGMLQPKILAVISGNHDDWTRDEVGIDMVARLAADNRVHYAPDEIIVSLRVGKVGYRVGLRHQYRFGSSFNLTHTVKRWWEMGMDPWDIGVICHHHQPAVEGFVKHGRRIWAARPGSYQLTSGFGRRFGFNHALPTCPTFILFPDSHYIMGFWDVHEAAGFLAYLRKGWPKSGGFRPAA